MVLLLVGLYNILIVGDLILIDVILYLVNVLNFEKLNWFNIEVLL